MNRRPAGDGPPPLPPRPRPAPVAPPDRRLHGCLVALLVAGGLAVPTVGILAAIAIPAYRDYVARARAGQALADVAPLQPQVAGFVARTGRCPTHDDEGFGVAGRPGDGAHATVAFGGGDGSCVIEVRLQDGRGGAIDGRRLWLEYDVEHGAWRCRADVDARHLPAACRG